ncbi:MAG: hypothetical protein JWN07_2973 [Hyphomicrobiales bacterium]|nr:hypothetical protein [Hyphomicrobiales bacterium]
MTSTIRRFYSDRSGREFALNLDHVISLRPGPKAGTVEATLVGSTLVLRGGLREVLTHIAHGTAMTDPPGQGGELNAESDVQDDVNRNIG